VPKSLCGIERRSTVLLSTTVSANGTWSILTDELAEGAYKFKISESGHLKASSTSAQWTVDTHTTVGIDNNDAVVNESAFTLTGKAEASDTPRQTSPGQRHCPAEEGRQRRWASMASTDGGNNSSFDPSISSDGHYVAFWSQASNLTGTPDTNGNTADIFIYDTVNHTTTNITDGGNAAAIPHRFPRMDQRSCLQPTLTTWTRGYPSQFELFGYCALAHLTSGRGHTGSCCTDFDVRLLITHQIIETQRSDVATIDSKIMGVPGERRYYVIDDDKLAAVIAVAVDPEAS
jgi:hypothetical protein